VTHIALQKTMSGYVPCDQQSKEWDEKVKLGTVIHSDFKKMRNGGLHRKLFALLNLAFEYWEPGEINSKYGVPEKNFERFRKDCIILAGYHELVIRLDGTTRIEAKSISFASMDNTEFEKLYNGVLNVILKRVNVLCDMSADDVNNLVNQVLNFG
jgi:hypothetical protein